MVTFVEALLDGEPVEIHGDGFQTRSLTYVTDTVDGIVRALGLPSPAAEIINVGGAESISILELAETIQSALGIPLPLRATFVPLRELARQVPGRPSPRADQAKARALLGFEAKIGLAEGLAATIDWHQKRRVEGEREAVLA